VPSGSGMPLKILDGNPGTIGSNAPRAKKKEFEGPCGKTQAPKA
jgi:hypothetical protein